MKDPTPLEEAAELARAVVEALTAVEEELTPKLGTEKEVCVVVLLLLVAAGVEALVVVTVENNGDGDVPRDREVGFAVGVVETAAADEAAAVVKRKED